MIIQTERLLLRPLSLNDLYTTHQYVGDTENIKYMVYFPSNNLEETKEFISKAVDEWNKTLPLFYEFAVVFKSEHIGSVSIYLDEKRTEAELAWIIKKDYWGKGYATEAAKAIKDFAVDELKVKRILACCDSKNTASYHIMQKLSLQLENDTQERKNKNSSNMSKELIYSLDVE